MCGVEEAKNCENAERNGNFWGTVAMSKQRVGWASADSTYVDRIDCHRVSRLRSGVQAL